MFYGESDTKILVEYENPSLRQEFSFQILNEMLTTALLLFLGLKLGFTC